MLQPSKQRQFYEQQVKGLYQGWVQTQENLKEITDPTIKALWMDDLNDIHREAQQLINEPLLDRSLYLGHLKLILSRTPEQWAVLLKANDKPLL